MDKQFIEKSNSSYGRWAIRTSATEIKFFWKKSDAVKYQESIREYLEAREMAVADGWGN